MPTEPTISPKAIAWALLSQSIWLPLLAIDAHDRWQVRVKELTPPPPADQKGTDVATASLPPEAPAASSPLDNLRATTGYVLSSASGKIGSLLDRPLSRSLDLASPGPSTPAPSPGRRLAAASLKTISPSPAPFRIGTASMGPSQDLFQTPFTRSELLGGVLTIHDHDVQAMPPLARAERARWLNTGDPMAPLPQSLREPMRQAIHSLSAPTPTKSAKLQQGRVIYVPSTRVSKPTQVPLALQSDGTVDVLSRPDDPGVIEDIKEWSSRQTAPASGTVTPAVVNLQPIPPEPPVKAAPAPARVAPGPVAAAPTPPPELPPAASVAPASEAMAPQPATPASPALIPQ
jgi:hypothetical protein